MSDAISDAREMIKLRLAAFPESPLFLYASNQMHLIDDRIASSNKVDPAFYNSLNIGLMCVRELENSDPEFCDVIYAMLEEIRPKV